MSVLIGLALLGCALIVALPILVLFIECMAGVAWRGPAQEANVDPAQARPRVVVLIPAHNEQQLLDATLDTVLPQLGPRDRALVVAHNCSDGTAEVARARGAEVVEARDNGTGGKPDALKAGLAALDRDPPEVVVVIDADCSAGPGSIARLVDSVAHSGDPAMAVYLFEATGEGGANQSISSLALLVKNHVRPLGLHALGLPCLLNGSGSAYPFELLRYAPHGEGSIAEDYQLAIDLLEGGHPTRFVPSARVDSRLPEREKTALKQRRRWEHGHLYLVFRTAPGLILRGLVRGDRNRVALGLELAVPPLAFLVLGWGLVSALVIAGVFFLGWGGALSAALWVCAGSGLLLFGGILAAFMRFLGPCATLKALVSIPGYILWKIPLYLGFPARREKRWTKTER